MIFVSNLHDISLLFALIFALRFDNGFTCTVQGAVNTVILSSTCFFQQQFNLSRSKYKHVKIELKKTKNKKQETPNPFITKREQAGVAILKMMTQTDQHFSLQKMLIKVICFEGIGSFWPRPHEDDCKRKH